MRSERFKFHAAHFVAFRGFRERLHGHNYTVGVRVLGPLSANDGYVIDFGDVKKVVRGVCEQLNERFLCPLRSDVLTIARSRDGANVVIDAEDGSHFSFPVDDCAMLPLVHSTAEELSAYLWHRTVEAFGVETLEARGVATLEIAVAETPTQEARYRKHIADWTPAPPKPPPTTTGCAAYAAAAAGS